MTYQTEFPDYDPATLPAIPSGWEDVSWHNDVCPSFTAKRSEAELEDGGWRLYVFIDYADPELREMKGLERFLAWCEIDGPSNGNNVLASNDWDAVVKFVDGFDGKLNDQKWAIAIAFVDKIREWLSEEERAEVVRRNRLPEYRAIGACATHDFCDANEAMAPAFAEVTGHEIDAESQADADLWGAAWDLAVQMMNERGWAMTKTIDSIWAAVAIDEADDVESLCVIPAGDMLAPLITNDEARLPFIREHAQAAAIGTGQTVRLIRLTKREVIETFAPPGGRHARH